MLGVLILAVIYTLCQVNLSDNVEAFMNYLHAYLSVWTALCARLLSTQLTTPTC